MPEDNVIDTNKINEAHEAFDQADPNLEFTFWNIIFTFNFKKSIHPTQNIKQSEDAWKTF